MNRASPIPTSRTTRRLTLLAGMLPWAAVTACGDNYTAGDSNAAATGIAAMSVESYAAAVRTLSSDEFEGRGPSTPGEQTHSRLPGRAVRSGGARARQRRFLLPGRPPGGADGAGHALSHRAGRPGDRAGVRVDRGLRRLDQAGRGERVHRGFRDGLRGVRCGRPRVRLERLRGRGRRRQDGGDPGQRPGVRDPGRSPLPRQRDDLLRPLDLQVRGGGPAGCGGRDHRPRGGAGGLPLGGRERELDRSPVRPGRGGRQHGSDPHRGLGARRGGARDLRGGRTRLRRARAGGGPARVPCGSARRLGLGGGVE